MSAESPGFSFSTDPQQTPGHVVGRASVPNRDPRATGEAPELPGAIPGVAPEAVVVPPVESDPVQPTGLAAQNPAESSSGLTYEQQRLAALEDAQIRTAQALDMIAAAFTRKPASAPKPPVEYGPGQDPITVRASARVGDPSGSRRLLEPELPVLQPNGSKVRVPARMEDAEGVRRAWTDEKRFGPQIPLEQIPPSAARSKVKLDNDRTKRRRGWVDHELAVREQDLRTAREAAPAAAAARAKAARRAMKDRLNPPGPIRRGARAIGRGTMSALRGIRHAAAEHLLPAFLDFGAKNRDPRTGRKRAPYV